MEAVYWQIKDDNFVFPKHLENICSASGRQIKEALKNERTGLQIFLRGSLLENEIPFSEADADLFVLFSHSNQLKELTYLLPSYNCYDIKLITKKDLDKDYVYHALLNCRSLQITGEKLDRKPISADKQFAWEHWIKYCPTIIPNRIDTKNSKALIHFKLLTRCFGVLSFLKYKLFTRDVSECIAIAKSENNFASSVLTEMRN